MVVVGIRRLTAKGKNKEDEEEPEEEDIISISVSKFRHPYGHDSL